jgi:hypothetical protein
MNINYDVQEKNNKLIVTVKVEPFGSVDLNRREFIEHLKNEMFDLFYIMKELNSLDIIDRVADYEVASNGIVFEIDLEAYKNKLKNFLENCDFKKVINSFVGGEEYAMGSI